MIEPAERRAGMAAMAAKGRWRASKWLILRRFSQIAILGLFLAGPLAGVWIIKGTLASSLIADTVPLSDPFIALQSLVAGHALEGKAIIGAVILLVLYALIGGRSYCAWVCPINPVADFAHWLRGRLGIRQGVALPRNLRVWLMAMVVIVSAVTGTVAWEFVNPITTLHRALVFGGFLAGTAWVLVLGVFLFDLLVVRRGWCGHVCPVGEAFGRVGACGLVRVATPRRDACDDCRDCYQVCPEPHVITPALKGADEGHRPVVLHHDCTNCGRCIDVCPQDVFAMGTRFVGTGAKARSERARGAAAGPGKALQIER